MKLPKVIDRVKKMLAIARGGSGNAHERDTAAATAAKLMAENGLEETDVNAQSVSEMHVAGQEWPAWTVALLKACATCRACALMRVRGDQGQTTACKLMGRQQACAEALLLHGQLSQAVKKETGYYFNQHPSAQESFRRGMVQSLRERLEKSDFWRPADPGVSAYVDKAYADANQMPPAGHSGDRTAFTDGAHMGMMVDIPDPRVADPRMKRVTA